mmetsp:Transcript_16301/g.27555  ORF Transcript_16301/g.27555 Transcript_16301/m.27555 type:complete len:177 (-) Transcript_16301:1002-1532(-)
MRDQAQEAMVERQSLKTKEQMQEEMKQQLVGSEENLQAMKALKKGSKLTKIDIANSKSEKYYKQFDFFFNRSCFRIMTEFYKEKFNKFYKSKMATLKKANFQLWQQVQKNGGLTATSKLEVDKMIKQFFDHLFGSDILAGPVSPLEKQQVIMSLMMIVFSHRYNKGDRFILEAERL